MMIIKSVALNNIRSYTDAEISLPTGSVLLAGDIGSGKSTVLLAIDFVLFGARKGELSGSALLRNGEKTGNVTLVLEINSKTITVHRSLKRGNDGGVTQDACWISVDGAREDLTPTELQSRILEILQYPPELLRKNKSLIYRYTVYTPQEAMKQILTTNVDERLQILRKVFDIDKYKTISDNANELGRELRSDAREMKGFVADLETKQQEMLEKERELADVRKNYTISTRVLNSTKSNVAEKKKAKETLSRRIEEMQKLKQEIASLTSAIISLQRQAATIDSELSNIDKQLKTFPEIKLPAKPAMTMDQIDKQIFENEHLKEKSLEDRTTSSNEMNKFKNILNRGVCDTCGQAVADKQRFIEKITRYELLLSSAESRMRDVMSSIDTLKKAKLGVIEYEKKLQEQKHAEEQKKYLESQLAEKSKQKKEIEKSLRLNEKQLSEINPRINEALVDELRKIENELDTLVVHQTVQEREQSRLQQQLTDLIQSVEKLSKEIAEKEKTMQQSQKIEAAETWLTNLFMPLMSTIEKHVLVKLQYEFNQLFQNWFNMLIDNELLIARIDERFTPVIEQNGYETDYDNLSGGEKTSVALAYRLALNKVINQLVERIQTKELLILDEPTDGFSTSQMEKVRDVLQSLGLKQVIIVSHEPMIDSFVENVIRFTKEGHVTRVVS
ncbi:MAG: AAA family ATPase [Candidatus Aenigmatarchaeota archaeon]